MWYETHATILFSFAMERMSHTNIVQVIVQIYSISNLSPQLYFKFSNYNHRTPTWHIKTVKVNLWGVSPFDHKIKLSDLILIHYQGDFMF